MSFGAPHWLWLALAAPLVAAAAWLLWRRRLAAAAAWAARGLWGRLLPTLRRRRLVVSSVLLGGAALGIAFALAQPRWGLADQQVEREGVDVVFVLDTSLSMATRDVAPDRLFVAQTLVRRLVERLPGHRVALVQAEGDGVVMVPLTVDGAVIDLLLDAVQPGSLPTPGTLLAPAIDRARELFAEDGDKHRVMVVLSDGEDHGSGLDEALARLVEGGVIVHAVGVGTPEGKPLEVPGGSGSGRVVYKQDEEGNVVVSRLHEENLERLARETGGLYLRGTSAGAEVARIAERIDDMEKRSLGAETVTALEERFQWPTALAVFALALQLALAPFATPREVEE